MLDLVRVVILIDFVLKPPSPRVPFPESATELILGRGGGVVFGGVWVPRLGGHVVKGDWVDVEVLLNVIVLWLLAHDHLASLSHHLVHI